MKGHGTSGGSHPLGWRLGVDRAIIYQKGVLQCCAFCTWCVINGAGRREGVFLRRFHGIHIKDGVEVWHIRKHDDCVVDQGC